MTPPPHNTAAEVAILGALLLTRPDEEGQALFENVSDFIDPSDFFEVSHQRVFTAIRSLRRGGYIVDAVTVSEELRRRGTLDAVGGAAEPGSAAAFLDTLIERAAADQQIEPYARLVRDKGSLRRLITMSKDVHAMATAGDAVVDEVAAYAEGKVFAATAPIQGLSWQAPEQYMSAFDADLASRTESKIVPGVRTGYTELDALVGCMSPADLVIIGARPSMGKSALALGIANNAANEGRKVGILSMEMSISTLVKRLVALRSGVSLTKIYRGVLSPAEGNRVDAQSQAVRRLYLHLDDTSVLTVADARTRARRLRARMGGLDLLVVDYLQLMKAEARGSNRNEEVGAISRGLKAIARDLDIPVIALAQLNRAAAKEERPTMDTLRDSGSIEADADIVMLLWKASYGGAAPEGDEDVEVIVAKHRNGPTGVKKLLWRADLTRFEDLPSAQTPADIAAMRRMPYRES